MLKKLVWGAFVLAWFGVFEPRLTNTTAYAFGGAWSKRLVIDEVSIPVAQDIALTGKLYRRRDSNLMQPAVILISPWSVGIWVYDRKARELAGQGYTVLAYNPRGWAGSGGKVDSAGPDDVADATAVIDWLSQNARVDQARIGMGGISLGAGTALMTAAYDARIRAVVAFSGWTDLFTSSFGNNTERTLWGRILNISAQVLGGSIVDLGADVHVKARDIEKIKAFTDPRSPVHLLDRYRQNQTAIFLSQNYSDFLFPVSDIWSFFERLDAPKRIRLQPGIHASAEVLEIFFEKNDELWLDAQAWLDHWVRDRGVAGYRRAAPEIHLTLSGEQSELEFENLDELSTPKSRYYLQKGQIDGFDRLAMEIPVSKGSRSIVSAVASGVTAGIPLIYPLVDSVQPIETRMSTRGIRLDRAAIYEWGPFGQDTKMLGIPRLQLKVESSEPEAQLVAYLFRVTPKDEWKVVSIAPYSAFDFVPGQPRVIEFDLFSGFSSWDAGEKLVLAIDTYDPEFAPTGRKDFKLKIHSDGYSHIDLPLVEMPK